MEDTRMIFPDEFFKAVWKRTDIKVEDIAAIYGTSRAAIYRAAVRFGLGPRVEPVVVVPEQAPRPTTYREELMWSGGKWAILRDIAEKHEKSMQKVMQDYHSARVRHE